jgi:AcrR family transcriptional regulator
MTRQPLANRTTVGSSAPDGDVAEEPTKHKILEAAHKCFMQLGISRTTLHDVARVAEVSRGTVYRYFTDREELIDATIEHRSRKYYSSAAAAMAARSTLRAQIGAFGEVVSRHVLDFQSNRLLDGDQRLMRLSASDHEGALRRMSHFLLPYVQEAKARGEVPDVDEAEATEYIARLLMSITTTPVSTSFNIKRPASVGAFMERYAVFGVGGED